MKSTPLTRPILRLHHHPPHPRPILPPGPPLIYNLSQHPQLHWHLRILVICHDLRLIGFLAQVAEAVALSKGLALIFFSIIPPGWKKVGTGRCEAKEVAERGERVGGVGVEALWISDTFEGPVVLLAQAEAVDE